MRYDRKVYSSEKAALKNIKATHRIGTVCVFKKQYLEEAKRQENSQDEVRTLPILKHKKKVILGSN